MVAAEMLPQGNPSGMPAPSVWETIWVVPSKTEFGWWVDGEYTPRVKGNHRYRPVTYHKVTVEYYVTEKQGAIGLTARIISVKGWPYRPPKPNTSSKGHHGPLIKRFKQENYVDSTLFFRQALIEAAKPPVVYLQPTGYKPQTVRLGACGRCNGAVKTDCDQDGVFSECLTCGNHTYPKVRAM